MCNDYNKHKYLLWGSIMYSGTQNHIKVEAFRHFKEEHAKTFIETEIIVVVVTSPS